MTWEVHKMFEDIQVKDKIYKNYVNGKWVLKEGADLITIKSPIDGGVVGKVAAMSPEDVDNIIQVAKDAQIQWKKMPINKRADILNKASFILEEHVDALVEIMLYETGKDRKSGRSEVMRTADYIRFTADSAKTMPGESIPGETFPGFNKSKISLVTREPLGVILAISPFNYPINLSASKIAPALVVGNTVVLKPATQGAISTMYLAKMFELAGLPAGVLNTVTGYGKEIGDYIVTHKDIDFINFTGSTEVGKRIAGLVNMKPLLMELGGKDPAIVLSDADLGLAVENIISGAYSYSGQRCTAVKRILVVDSVADALVSKLKPRVEMLKVGNPATEEDIIIVPLIDEKSAEYVESLIDEAVEKGADLLVGGKREKNLVYPALLDHVTTEMKLAWEEPFGPVLPIIRVKNKEEAISIANQSEYGLQSCVFTESINEAFDVASKLEVGTVQVNNKTERGPDNFPFLGVKSSGIGVQGIKYSIEAMSRPKAIVININPKE